jgi:hypothetical protein
MRLRSLLAGLALAGSLGIGSVAMASTASAATTPQWGPQCQSKQCNQQPPKCESWQQGRGDSRDNACCQEEIITITFDFAPNRGAPKGTWLLETGGPALHDGLALTYEGTTWIVSDWTPGGHGTLGVGEYFTLVKGGVTLTGGRWENPQTAWWSERQICLTSVDPCNQQHGYTTDAWDGSSCIPCKPVTLPCKPVVKSDPCKPLPKAPCNTGGDKGGKGPAGPTWNQHGPQFS